MHIKFSLTIKYFSRSEPKYIRPNHTIRGRDKFCDIDNVKQYANASHFGISTRFILYIIILKTCQNLNKLPDLI